MKRIAFIGPGKAGCSFGRHIAERGEGSFEVIGYAGRGEAGKALSLAAECDLLLITVPDKLIAEVWESLSEKLPERNAPLFVGHLSGSRSSEIFIKKPCCHFGSVHPILAIHDKETSYKNFVGAYFTIEGDVHFKILAAELLTTLENPFCDIDADQKTRYHAASVMVSNLVCAIAYQGAETFKGCGLEDDFADNAWRSLFLGNAENTAKLGPVLALTGPVERCDTETVARHLESLSGDAREIYLLLSRTLIETAQRKNPGRDYSEMRNLLI